MEIGNVRDFTVYPLFKKRQPVNLVKQAKIFTIKAPHGLR
jgi:hypothetical protein